MLARKKNGQLVGITPSFKFENGKKYNGTINGIIGDVDANGELKVPTEQTSFNFTGVKNIPAYLLQYKFYRNTAIIGANFPDLTTVGNYGMQNAFYAYNSATGKMTSLSMPKLQSVGSYGLNYAFYEQALTNVEIDLPKLSSMSNYAFSYAFNGSDLKSFTTNELLSCTAPYAFQYTFANNQNNNFEVHFRNLATLSGNNIFQSACYGTHLFYNKVGHPFPDLVSIDGSNIFASAFGYSMANRIIFDKLETVGNNTASTTNIFGTAFIYPSMVYEPGHTNEYDRRGVFFPSLISIGQNSTSSTRNFTQFFGSNGTNHTLHFYDLQTIYNSSSTTSYGQFYQCQAKRVYMPKVTDMGTYNKNCFYSSTNTEELHFGYLNRSTIEAMAGYSTKFGATNATIYFDMMNELIIEGSDAIYYRDGANCDLDNWYFAWTNTNDPNDTIYTTNFKDPGMGETYYTKSGDTYISAGIIAANESERD